MKECPNCHNANQYGDYEGPTCEVCMGDGFISVVDTTDDLHRILGESLDKAKSEPTARNTHNFNRRSKWPTPSS